MRLAVDAIAAIYECMAELRRERPLSQSEVADFYEVSVDDLLGSAIVTAAPSGSGS